MFFSRLNTFHDQKVLAQYFTLHEIPLVRSKETMSAHACFDFSKLRFSHPFDPLCTPEMEANKPFCCRGFFCKPSCCRFHSSVKDSTATTGVLSMPSALYTHISLGIWLCPKGSGAWWVSNHWALWGLSFYVARPPLKCAAVNTGGTLPTNVSWGTRLGTRTLMSTLEASHRWKCYSCKWNCLLCLYLLQQCPVYSTDVYVGLHSFACINPGYIIQI